MQSAIARASAPAAAGHADAAVASRRSNPADQPILFLALQLADAAAVARSTSTPRRCSRSASRRSTGVAQVQVYGVAEVRGAGRSSTRGSWPPRGLGIDEVAQARARRQRQPARPGRSTGRSSSLHHRGRRASSPTPPPTGPLVVAYRNGRPVRLERAGHGHRQRRERQGRGLVQRRARRSSSRSSASPAPTRSRWPTGSRRCCRSSSAQLPAGVSTDDAASTARSRSASRSHDVKFTLLAHPRPRRAGDLPVPAQPLGDDHPQPGAADVDRRHLRGDVRCSATASTTCR